MITAGALNDNIANFNVVKPLNGGDYGGEDDLKSYEKPTPEERVARVAVEKSDIFKIEALKAVKEAAISKKVANRARENAHAFQK